ncbi:hypothetical protein IWX50DRAFT_656975 [Phyllosticta citricarpa]|uniref:Uncharacterized protein n=1 Tax=Phyllosticta citricarpa TaxID=55181 RepID=A0ABR1M6Q0_9PEZI
MVDAHDDELTPEQTEGFKVGEKKTIDEYQQLEGQEDEEGEDSVDNGAEPSAAPADSSDGQNQPFSRQLLSLGPGVPTVKCLALDLKEPFKPPQMIRSLQHAATTILLRGIPTSFGTQFPAKHLTQCRRLLRLLGKPQQTQIIGYHSAWRLCVERVFDVGKQILNVNKRTRLLFCDGASSVKSELLENKSEFRRRPKSSVPWRGSSKHSEP